MSIQICIVGLDQVGASIGLALAEKKKEFYRVGYDRDVKTGSRAIKDGAVDKSAFNLPSAVEKADYVALSVPAGELRAALQVIAPALKEGAVVIDTSPLKTIAQVWAEELIPPGCWYVSAVPTLGPVSFTDPKPSADLFRNSLMIVTAARGTPEKVVDQVLALLEILGGQTQFSDPAEHDGLTASVRHLPEMSAAALFTAVADQPGWQEGRKLAGAAFAQATAPLETLAGRETPADGLFQNRDNALRVLDRLIAGLTVLRESIAAGKEKETNEFFTRAAAARRAWMEQRLSGEWEKNLESTQAPDFMARLFGVGGKSSKK